MFDLRRHELEVISIFGLCNKISRAFEMRSNGRREIEIV